MSDHENDPEALIDPVEVPETDEVIENKSSEEFPQEEIVEDPASNPFEIDTKEISNESESISEKESDPPPTLENNGFDEEIEQETEEKSLKEYQNTLQELKEEIGRLNRQLDHRSKAFSADVTEEEVFKIKCLCKYSKQEVADLNVKLEEIQNEIEKAEAKNEALKANSFDDVTSGEMISKLEKKVKDLETEYEELCRPSSEINIADLDKILAPDANLKLVNEFFVNVQKRVGSLDVENTNLSATLKKYNQENMKLREKCDNAASRYKSNDKLKAKLKELENSFVMYTEIEKRLINDVNKAEEEFSIHHHSPENKFDLPTVQKMYSEIEDLVKKDKDEIEKLEFDLQEKKNMLRAARAYGIQRSKTSNKLRSDMELLGLVLIEKDQNISKLRKEIDEIKWKNTQVDLEIKDLNDKKIHV